MADKGKKETPPAAKVVAVLFVVIVAAGAILWFTNPSPLARLKARIYASRIGEGGDNGRLSKKMIALGTDAALPVALQMLTNKDYIARRHAILIIGQLQDKDKVRESMDDILAAMKNEDNARNRSFACSAIDQLYKAQPEHCGKVVMFLKDPDEEVRYVAIGSIQMISGIDLPGRTAEYWLEWWEKKKKEFEKK